MVTFPNAKINLGLHITSRRNDGFHNLETVFYPIQLCDIIEILPTPSAKETSLHISGRNIPGDKKENLCMKAWSHLQKRFRLPHVKIHLHKAIPFGSGLGGGSSDASHVILATNFIFKLNLSQSELMEIAIITGSDCAFFILNQPAYAEGRGEQLNQYELDLSGYYLHLIIPGVRVDTKLAFGLIQPKVPKISLREKIKLPVSEWKGQITNDFEVPIFQKFPELKKIKNKLYELGAVYASMSGSGSAVFGLFEKKPVSLLPFENCFYWSNQL
jgi:4-diphosphocytidyl-2-C-methyl-D-erythritol kinase